MFINGKSHLKAAVYILSSVYQLGKSFESGGMHISCVVQWLFNGESYFKVAVCTYHRVFINWESPLKVAVCIYDRVFSNIMGKVV